MKFNYLIISILFVYACQPSTKDKPKPTPQAAVDTTENTIEDTSIIYAKALGFVECANAYKNNDKPVTNADLVEVNNHFTFRGASINPKLVFLFIPWLNDDKPPILSIDIAAANVGTNQFYNNIAPYKLKSGYVQLATVTDSVNATYQSYQWLGMLSNNIHVLRCVECSTDGSGQFLSIVFVRFQIAKFNLNGKSYNQLLMNNICVYTVGDRVENYIELHKKANQIKLMYKNAEGNTISEIIKP